MPWYCNWLDYDDGRFNVNLVTLRIGLNVIAIPTCNPVVDLRVLDP